MIECPVCGDKFKPTTNFGHPKVYCSRKCKDKAYHQNLSSAVIAKYHKDSRQRQAQKPCVKCGKTPSVGHHIIPKEFNGRGRDNIVRICGECHIKLHKLYFVEIHKFIPDNCFDIVFDLFIKGSSVQST